MKSFQEFITEIFDSSYEFGAPTEKKTSFHDTILLTYQFYDKNKNKIVVIFSTSNVKDFWDCTFTSNGIYDITGGGDSLKIFATVINVINDFRKRKRPNKLGFSADKNEPSRVKLYKKFIQRYAKQFNFRYTQETLDDGIYIEEYFMVTFQ